MVKTDAKDRAFDLTFGHWVLGFDSDFGLRISDFYFRASDFGFRVFHYNPEMIHRIDVWPLDAESLGHTFRQQIMEMGSDSGSVTTLRIFLIDTDVTAATVRSAAEELFADPIADGFVLLDHVPVVPGSRIEVHLKPGVMDPVAASAEMAMRDLGIPVRQIRTGRALLLEKHLDRATLERIAARVLANGVIESVYFEAFLPTEFPTGHEHEFALRHVALRDLNDEQLRKLSREGHLFLSMGEMKAVQEYFRAQEREPSDIELETIAQTWSEHCVHKTLKSAVDVDVVDAAGKVVETRRYGNLIKDTIFASTQELMRGTGGSPVSSADNKDHGRAARATFCLSVFKDNAGVIVFDDDDAVCMKVETHNHPSAIEPYGGSATGIGGCIRDIMGTGLSARPVASTDVFCVAYPDTPAEQLPRGVIHPRRTLQQVVAGVRDYGNRMGIPTVNGAVYFDDRYVGNPLVFCGCVGMIPRDMIEKAALPGDAIVVMGGRTGRDGIHGATFSSAELTDTHADEFSHAVQIGNAITQKQVMDVILRARDRGLFTAITDCGAGGLSSAVGEMGEKTGASVELDKVPLKYAGLRYDEIWISEAQERMVLSVPQKHVAELLKLARDEHVEATVIGQFGTEGQELRLSYRGESVGRLSMEFLHDGLPMPTRKAVVTKEAKETKEAPHVHAGLRAAESFKDHLLRLLAHPNIASKHWIIRQYDHEVQGGSVIKPLIGPQQIGPSDAAVVRPKLGSIKGIALGCGLAPQIEDPYAMAIAAIDEAIRNVVCVGAKLDRIALLDNFCWPSVDDERTMGTLVRACEACRDAAIAFGTPFISGKDSLHNQFTDAATGRVIKIPATLLISAIGVLEDVRKCVTMDFKTPGAPVIFLRARDPADLRSLMDTHYVVSRMIARGEVAACHDVSEGGIAVAAAEMCIASRFGLKFAAGFDEHAFDELPGQYLIELRPGVDPEKYDVVGYVQREPTFGDSISIAELTAAWRGTLDW
jgi:phosphoribosylformylglycinamidine synthase II